MSMLPRALALFTLLGLVATSAAATKPSVRTVVVDQYPFEPRKAGDGAPILQVPNDVPEPLFLHVTKERLTVWWRARHTCDKKLRAGAKVEGPRLTLDVTEAKIEPRCQQQTTVFETRVEGWGNGPREVRSPGAPAGVASLWVSSPSPTRPKELTSLADRMRDREALRRLGERIAWRYHEGAETRAAIAAYRWLISLDELHWRTPLYQARIFHNAAFTRTKGGAIAALEALTPGLERLRERVAQEKDSAQLQEMKRELQALEAFLEPALLYLSLKWHSEALHRWHAAVRAYRAYVRLFPTSKRAPLVRFLYGSALLHTDDSADAREHFRVAAQTLSDPEQRELAQACAIVLGLEDKTWEQLAPCRVPKPEPPPFAIFPRAAEERFARPPALEE